MKTAADHSTHSTPTAQRRTDNSSPFFASRGQESKPESKGAFFQPQLKVGAPNDKYEREADQVADQVVQRLGEERAGPVREGAGPRVISKLPAISRVQRQVDAELQREAEEEQDSEVQRKPIFERAVGEEGHLQRSGDGSFTASDDFSGRLQSSKGGGSTLPEATRSGMESSIGADFSGVRVHTGNEAASLSNQIGAQAFTHGSDIYFNQGKYSPGSSSGDRLLAHELTHTVQQGAVLRRLPVQNMASPPAVQREWDWELPSVNIPTSVEDARNIMGGYADKVPGYALLSVAVRYDFVRGKNVTRNKNTILKGLFGLAGPFGELLRKRLEERGVIDVAYNWVKQNFDELGLTFAALRQKFDEFWAEKDIFRPDFIDYNLGLIKRKFAPFLMKIVAFGKRAATKLFQIVKDAFLQFLVDLAKKLGGYDLLADLLKKDPITGEGRNATTADILRGILKLPMIQAIGGDKLLQKLEEQQLIDKAAAWVDQQWSLLRASFTGLKNVGTNFVNGFSLETLRAPLEFINGLKTDVVGFVTNIGSFFKNLATKALELIKEASIYLLHQYLNENTPGFDLVRVILGKDPLTGEKYPRTATNIVGAFLKLLPGGAALFEQLKQTGAIQKAASWITGAIQEFVQIFGQLKESFFTLWQTSTIADLFAPIALFQKIFTLFKEPVVRLVGFVKRVVTKIFEVLLSIMKFPINIAKKIIANVQRAFQQIKKDPIAFLKNLLRAVKEGFKKFFSNIGKHLLAGVTGWLMGQMAKTGVNPPKDMSLGSLFGFALEIMEVTMEKVWSLLAKRIGQEKVNKIRAGIDKLTGAWQFIKDVTQNGVSMFWNYLKEKVTGLWDMVVEKVKSWTITKIIEKVTARLLSMLDPTGIMAVVNGFMLFFDAIKSAIEYARQMLDIVANFTGGLAEIAIGAVGKAADFLEKGLAKVIPVAIGFLANMLGLDRIGDQVRKVIKAIRVKVEKGLSWLVDKAVKGIGKIMGMFKGKKKGEDPLEDAKDLKFTKKERDAGLAAFEKEEKPYVKENKIGREDAGKVAKTVKGKHPVFKSISVVDGGDDWEYGYVFRKRKRQRTSSRKIEPIAIQPPEISINTNLLVVRFTQPSLDDKTEQIVATQSLQRHHYFYMANANAENINSLYHLLISKNDIKNDIKLMFIKHNKDHVKAGKSDGRFWKGQAVTKEANSRRYRFDTANHFFVLDGEQVAENLSQNEFIAIRSFRILEGNPAMVNALRNFREVMMMHRQNLNSLRSSERIGNSYIDSSYSPSNSELLNRIDELSGIEDRILTLHNTFHVGNNPVQLLAQHYEILFGARSNEIIRLSNNRQLFSLMAIYITNRNLDGRRPDRLANLRHQVRINDEGTQ